ncbi:MAG: hypothetical protein V4635_13455 [Bacteroidota bacterium]
MKRIYLIYFVLLSAPAWSQTAGWENISQPEMAEAYRSLCRWFTNTASYSVKLKYTSYSSAVAVKPIESAEGYYKRESGNYVTEIMGIKTLQNSAVRVILDTADKMITVMSPAVADPMAAVSGELESWLKNVSGLRKIKTATGIRYRIDFMENKLYEACEFAVSSNGRAEQLTYYYSEQVEKHAGDLPEQRNKEIRMKPRLEVRFTDYRIPADHTASVFSERSILTRDEGKLKPATAFRDYRILDYRKQEKK